MWAIVEGQILQVLRPTARRPANVSKFPVIQLNGRSGLLDRYALNVDLEIKSYSKSVNILLIFLQFSFSLQYSLIPGSKIVDDLGPILFAHAVRAWANVVHALGNALGDDNIGPGSDHVRKQYWAKFGATRVKFYWSSIYTISTNSY